MKLNERGSMLMAMMLGLAIIAGSIALFDYLQASNVTLGYVSDRSRVDPGQAYIFARLKTCLTLADPSKCPKSAEFKTMMTLPVTMLDDTTVAPVAPISLTKSDMESVTGFLTSRQAELDLTFDDFTAKVERQASPDDPVLGSTRVSITLTLKPHGHVITLQTRDVTRSYRVTIQSPVSFGLILRNPANPAIVLNPSGPTNSSLTVVGGTLLFTNVNIGLQPKSIVNSSFADYVRFDRAWTTSSSIDINTTADRDSYRIFQDGIQVHAFDSVDSPFVSTLPWDQPLDYAYVYSSNGYPLPKNLQYTTAKAAHAGSTCDRKIDYNITTGLNENRSTETNFPSTLVMGTASLNETCARPDNFAEGSMKALILLRGGTDLSFDYTAAGGAQYACGMVVADKVTFTVPNGQTVAWYGNINANKIVINGGGHLVILNPFSASSKAGDLPQPPNLAISELQTLYITLGSSTGHNFFVPFTRNMANFPVNIGYNTLDTYFTIPATAGYCSTWVDTVDPPNLTPYLTGATWDKDIYFTAEESL